jgi:hypothetical protein
LYAVGYVNGKEVAKDYIVLNDLPQAPHFGEFYKNTRSITQPQAGYYYLYRVNCGGGDYIDENGSLWMADRPLRNDEWTMVNHKKNRNVSGENENYKLERNHAPAHFGSISWTNDFPGMPPFFASQQRTFDPIHGTKDWKLFQTFRFGREKLKYYFPVQNGEYLVELYFTEPWLGTGGGMDCTGMRLFDVAVNGKTVLKNVDIWKEAGHDGALKKTVKVKVTGGALMVSFPKIASGQAVISAIAIATLSKDVKPALPSEPILKLVKGSNDFIVRDWLDLGDEQFTGEKTSFSSLPPEIFGAEWIKTKKAKSFEMPSIELTRDADLFIGMDTLINQSLWLKNFTDTKTFIKNDHGDVYRVYKKRFQKGASIKLYQEGVRNDKMYLMMVQPASNIEPAYDLKPVASYKAIEAKWQGPGVIKGQVDGKDRIIFQKASPENVLEWDFSVGVADMYSLTVSYNSSGSNALKGKLQLLSADGTLMKEEEIVFTPTKPGKSNYISTNTGTMINAGHYKLRLTSGEAVGLSINSLDVQ